MAATAKKPRTKKAKPAEPETGVVAYKAFNSDLTCLGFQYEVGKSYEHSGTISLCDSGFHSCLDPLDVLRYYDITDCRFARVRASGKIDKRTDGDSKIASAAIHIEAELKLPEFIGVAIKWITDACKAGTVNGSASSGHYAKNASSGDYAKNASSGYYATNASSGYSATNASSGYSATNASSGYYATNASSGYYATNASSGYSATNASSGDSAKNASSGHSAKNASSGHSAKNASSGYYATNASSGHYGSNEATGEHAVICGAGRETRYKGAKGVWISAAEYAYDAKLGRHVCIGFATGQAGYGDVPADTWLVAKGGKLVPA